MVGIIHSGREDMVKVGIIQAGREGRVKVDIQAGREGRVKVGISIVAGRIGLRWISLEEQGRFGGHHFYLHIGSGERVKVGIIQTEIG